MTTMYACVTVQETAAAETAVCGDHLAGFVPAPDYRDVTDHTLRDCSGNDALCCQVCGVRNDGTSV